MSAADQIPAARKVALISGVTGQDGAYLARFLLNKGYEVHGIRRCCSLYNSDRTGHLHQDPDPPDHKSILLHGDLIDSTILVHMVQPDKMHYLGVQSDVAASFQEPEYAANADGIAAPQQREASRICELEKRTRFCQASTRELYSLVQEVQEVPHKGITPLLFPQLLPRSQSPCLLDRGELP